MHRSPPTSLSTPPASAGDRRAAESAHPALNIARFHIDPAVGGGLGYSEIPDPKDGLRTPCERQPPLNPDAFVQRPGRFVLRRPVIFGGRPLLGFAKGGPRCHNTVTRVVPDNERARWFLTCADGRRIKDTGSDSSRWVVRGCSGPHFGTRRGKCRVSMVDLDN